MEKPLEYSVHRELGDNCACVAQHLKSLEVAEEIQSVLYKHESDGADYWIDSQEGTK